MTLKETTNTSSKSGRDWDGNEKKIESIEYKNSGLAVMRIAQLSAISNKRDIRTLGEEG